ncbi:6-phosphogluconate dehydrogenase [Theileria orientalis]|uniref:6-phosphogluconate dehydrogenase, decarboxylating n=1 Tax=Theileria orientalis TaxID=68886 RepID=A0A976QU61_THEOR|nr:6-phosphogluconate dehydrogenase [Theileria orientalis]
MEESKKAEIGIVGLGVMGGAYARNLYFRGRRVSAWTRSDREIEVFEAKIKEDEKYEKKPENGSIKCFTNLQEFVDSLEKPRKVLLLITAGSPVDHMLDRLIPSLDKEDIIVDGGNEWYKNTQVRIERCKEEGIRFCGMGVSGGERGARNHPCFMFGGSKEDYTRLKPVLSQDDKDFYVGKGASGHYVKMVHNGIEYAILQVLSELYKIMKHINKMSNQEISELLRSWDEKESSYLLQITQMILNEKEGEEYLVDKITPCISSNGTGKWTVQDSFDRSVPVPSIGMAVDMRIFSNLTQNNHTLENTNQHTKFKADDLKKTYTGALISIYSQGMHLVMEASREFEWDLNMSNVADIWSSNAIISCNMLKEVSKSYKENDEMLLFHPRFKEMLLNSMKPWKHVVKNCIEYDVPTPGILSSLEYVQVLFSKNHCHNLIQAQRDCFGSHGFSRVDMEGNYHHNWWKNHK